MHFPFIVVKRLSVPVIVGCDFQREYTKAILPKDGKIAWTTGAVSPILGYHLGARGRQYKKPGKARARPNELTLAGVTVLPPGAQTPVKVVTRSTGSCVMKGRAEFLAKHGFHLAHGYHKKVRRQEPFSVLLINLGRTTKTFTKGTRVGVAEPYTGEARPLSQEALLSVQQELAAQEALDKEALLAQAEAPPEAPLAPPTEEPETPEVNWDAIPEALHGKVRQLLDEFKGMWSGRLGELKATTHHIQLKPDAKPVYSAPYRAGPHRRQYIEKQVKKMLDLGVIEPSDAEWSFPVVVVPKPGGHFRFCVDYRRLNERTVKDVYPIPRMDDCLDSLGDATVFSTLDCNAGYWQIPVAVEDRDKTTFTSHTGLFRYPAPVWPRERTGVLSASSGHHPVGPPVADMLDLPGRCDRLLPDGGRPRPAPLGSTAPSRESRCLPQAVQVPFLPARGRVPGTYRPARAAPSEPEEHQEPGAGAPATQPDRGQELPGHV